MNALRGRPELSLSYEQDQALLNTRPKRLGVLLVLLVALLLPLRLDDDLVYMLATGFAAAIGAIGLNLVTGYAGQVSLGHAFFLGVGAITAAVLGGDPDNYRAIGLGLPMIVWLPGAGLVAGLAGLLVGPLATRLRGLYLAIVTLGLVFLGEHAFKELKDLSGGVGVGRAAPDAVLFGMELDHRSQLGALTLTGDDKLYLFALVLLVLFAVLGRNVARSAVGRAFSAIRDRDIAASIIGVPLTRYKVLAFVISSAFAGISGAVLYTIVGHIEPGSFNLLQSVRFIAMVLIGGVATISGSIMGALFITLLPRVARFLVTELPFLAASAGGAGLLDEYQVEAVLYGALVIGFLVFEPRGLFGLWLRVRNYWKGWPFSY